MSNKKCNACAANHRVMVIKYQKAFCKFLFLIALMIVPLFADCQPYDSPTDDLPNDPGTEAPIDSGVFVLIAVGIIYGIQKAKRTEPKTYP